MPAKSLPDLNEEIKLWRKGCLLVIGVDEAGRGAFAGPVVAGAVVFIPQVQNSKFRVQSFFPSQIEKWGINDSKKLTAKKREKLARLIKKAVFLWATAEVGVSVINRLGIGRATEKAMRRAVYKIVNQELRIRNKENGRMDTDEETYVLSDAFHIKYLKRIGLKNQKAIIRGDQKCISIAAASILAKVHRDGIMERLAKMYPKYGWERNKGYGTAKHRQVIEQVGITRWHRQAFVNTWLRKLKASSL